MEDILAWLRTPLGTHALFTVLIAWPVLKVLSRAGLSLFWFVLAVVPLIGLPLLLLTISIRSWPKAPKVAGPKPPVPWWAGGGKTS